MFYKEREERRGLNNNLANADRNGYGYKDKTDTETRTDTDTRTDTKTRTDTETKTVTNIKTDT